MQIYSWSLLFFDQVYNLSTQQPQTAFHCAQAYCFPLLLLLLLDLLFIIIIIYRIGNKITRGNTRNRRVDLSRFLMGGGNGQIPFSQVVRSDRAISVRYEGKSQHMIMVFYIWQAKRRQTHYRRQMVSRTYIVI